MYKDLDVKTEVVIVEITQEQQEQQQQQDGVAKLGRREF